MRPRVYSAYRLTLLPFPCADAWRGSDQGGLIARAMAAKPTSALSAADSAAAKQTVRITEVVASIERYDRLLSDPTLKPPDGGAMVRAVLLRASSDVC